MVFFFALATKEIVEATLPGGALASPKAAAVPLVAAAAGMIVPAALYCGSAAASGHPDLARGWAIPCATDIAFSYLVARMIFPRDHPAIPFLLLLAVADDALGLLVLARVLSVRRRVASAVSSLFMVPALAIAWGLKRRRVRSFWPYMLARGLLFLGRAVSRRPAPGARTGPDRAVHAARRALPRLFDDPASGPPTR